MSFNLGGKLSLDAGDFVRSARQAQTSVEDVDAELKELDGRKIELEADASKAKKEISQLRADLLEVDGMDARAEVVANIADAKADLDRVQAEIRDIDGRTADIRVDADTSGLDDALGKLGEMPGAFGDIGSSIQGMINGPAGILGAVSAVSGAVFTLASNTADAAIEAQTYADLTGSTVEDASRLLAVTKQVGIESSDLSDITLQTSQGLRDNADYAAKLGINLADGKNPAERLVEVLDKMNTSQLSANEKAEIFAALLGEEGVRQGQQLATQIGNIEQAMRGVSDANVFTPEEAAKAAEFRQMVNEIKMEFQGFANTLGQQAIPELIEFGENVQWVTGLIGDATDQVAGLAGLDGGGFAGLWGVATDVLNPMGFAVSGLRTHISDLGDELETDLHAAIDLTGTDLSTFEQRVRAADLAAQEFDAVADARQSTIELGDSADRTATQLGGMAEQVGVVEDSLSDLVDQQRAMVDPAFAAMKAQEDLEAALAAVSDGSEVTDAKLRDVVSAQLEVDRTSAALAETTAATAKEIYDMGIKAGLTHEQAMILAGGVSDVTVAAEEFADDYEATLAVDDQANGPLSDAKIKADQLDGRTVSLNIKANYVNFQQARTLANESQYRATGGPVVGGQTYLVGEYGPELFTAPTGGGTIIDDRVTSALQNANYSHGPSTSVATPSQTTGRPSAGGGSWTGGFPLTQVFLDGGQLAGTVVNVVNNRKQIDGLMK